MASLAFLLAPLREIPASADDQWMAVVSSWLHVANWTWYDLWNALPDDQKRGAPRMPPGTGLSSNAADASLKKDPQILASAKPWAERAWNDWNASGRTAPLPVVDAGAAHAALNLESRMALPNLTAYAGGFVAVPAAKLKRGGRHAFVKNEGDANAFAFGEDDGTQRALFLEIARGHGGDHLAVWTFGHAVNVLVARSTQPGDRPTLHGPFSVRARVAAGTARPAGLVDALTAALAGSAIKPDVDALRRELDKPELSIAAVALALGVPGAIDFASPDIAARWDDLDRVGRALLTGEAVDKKALKNVQQLLEPFGAPKLPSKGKLGKGDTARLVATAALEMKNAMSVPEQSVWTTRFRAAAFYWDICDGPALDRLTTGADKAGLGTAASVARLLAHFPDALLRDPVFLATLAIECEAANGHAFVEGLSKLAEQTTTTGLVVVAAREASRAAMRKAFGIDGGTAVPDGPWCGEALAAGTTLTKGDVAQLARAWMGKAKATGAVAELLAGGTVTVGYFKDGAAAQTPQDAGLGQPDEAALRQAAKGFLPRQAFVALGAGDVLAPGEWHEGAYSGQAAPGVDDHRARKRRQVDGLAAARIDARPLKQFGELPAIVGRSMQYAGPLAENDGGFVTLRVTPPVDDDLWLRALRNDLKGESLISRYGDAWVHEAAVRGYSCSSIDTALLAQVLGDAPSGTELAIWRGPDVVGAWRIA